MNEYQSTLFIHTQAPFSIIKPLWLWSPCYFSSRAWPTTNTDWLNRQVHYAAICFSMLWLVCPVVPYSVAYTSVYVIFPVDLRVVFIYICNSMTAQYYNIRFSTAVCTVSGDLHTVCTQNEAKWIINDFQMNDSYCWDIFLPWPALGFVWIVTHLMNWQSLDIYVSNKFQ